MTQRPTDEPRMDARRESFAALGLLALGVALILALGPPRFSGMGVWMSSGVFLLCLAALPLASLALDRLNAHPR